MANQSIKAAFERMWQHTKNAIDNVSTVEVSNTEPTKENVDLWINPSDEDSINIPEINDDVVSEVDTWSSSKITEELSKAGTQPDWNQKDSTASDYIKNKPFYTKDPAETIIIEQTTFTLQGGFGVLVSTRPLEVGQEYTITLDGTTYNCVAKNNVQFGGTYLGNASIVNAGEDTGESFFIGPYSSETTLGIMINSDIFEHTVSVTSIMSEVVKIDEKYLPDSINNLFETTYDTITWDGNTENVEMITMPHPSMPSGVMNYVKVSDNVLTYDDFSNGLSFKNNYYQEYYMPQDAILESNGFIGDYNLTFMVVPTDNFEFSGTTISKKGFYLSFYDYEGYKNYISSLRIYGYNGFSVATKKLKTIPVQSGGTGCDSIVDTTYYAPRYRASSLHSSETTPTINGVIAWTYE